MSAGVQAVEMRHEVDWVGRIVLMAILAFALWSLVSGVYAGTADEEFRAGADKTSGWVTGKVGIALGFGIIFAAVKKDWGAFMGAVFISLGVGIIVGIINKAFTAVI